MNPQLLPSISLRRSEDRGKAEHGWLHSRHTFSFADYYDPEHLSFHTLRVINDDRIEPGQGFGTHPHRDMEIVSYVVEGALEHRDNMGNGSIIRAHDIQRMSAGSGVQHSEYNPQSDAPVHFLQIWILPGQKGVTPSYEQKAFPPEAKQNRLRLVVSPDGAEGSVTIGQDVRLFATLLEPGHEIHRETDPAHHLWVQVVKGRLTVNGETLETGDGAALENTAALNLTGIDLSEVLVFDLA